MNDEEVRTTTIPALLGRDEYQPALRQRVMSMILEPELVPAVLTWKNLEIRNATGEKVLLKGSGQINGGIWAIMGPSGSGKSILLNTLACRLDSRVQVKGEIRLNARHYTNTELKKMAGYVLQDDLLSAFLTVEETLDYTATLRLPELTAAERKDRVSFVIREMGLSVCRNVIVGDTLRKGISGGQRRRLSVAQELLLKPSLLFLDEPTSGLDSFTALELVKKLRDLSRTVCTVVCSIHQPQAKIFNLFDSLILMKAGRIVFFGSLPRALKTFDDAGFPVPPMTNPADHMIDVLSSSSRVKANNGGGSLASASTGDLIKQAADHNKAGMMTEMVTRDESDRLVEKFEEPHIDLNFGADKPFLHTRGQVPWLEQFTILSRRSLKEQLRKRDIIVMNLVQTAIIAILIGTVFLNIGTSQASVKRRGPVLFFCCINQGLFGSLAVINSFPSERALSLRERAAGTYNVSAYFLSKSLVDTIPQVIIPVLFSCIVYFLIGLRSDGAGHFFLFMLFMVLCNVCATSAALMISALCVSTDRSVAVLPMFLEVSRLFGGWFLNPANLPKYFSWLDALSFYKYTFTGITRNEWEGLKLHCEPNELRNGVCPYVLGDQYVAEQGQDYISIGGCIGVLIGYIIFTRFVAYIAVKYIKN